MATLPTVPSFSYQDTSLAKLQQLAYAVSFLADCDVRPTWHAIKTSTQSLPASTFTEVTWSTTAYDNDGVFTPSLSYATIVTQGYYRTETCVNVSQAGTSGAIFQAAFKVTAGSNNTHHTSGTTAYYGLKGGQGVAYIANIDSSYCLGAMCPWVLFPGDTIGVYAYWSGSTTIDILSPTSFMTAVHSTSFTGHFVRTGS